jgi:hypothetical protein
LQQRRIKTVISCIKWWASGLPVSAGFTCLHNPAQPPDSTHQPLHQCCCVCWLHLLGILQLSLQSQFGVLRSYRSSFLADVMARSQFAVVQCRVSWRLCRRFVQMETHRRRTLQSAWWTVTACKASWYWPLVSNKMQMSTFSLGASLFLFLILNLQRTRDTTLQVSGYVGSNLGQKMAHAHSKQDVSQVL